MHEHGVVPPAASDVEPQSAAYAWAMLTLLALAILYAIAAYVQWSRYLPWLPMA